jgi:Flp pilus assembly protein CpaB
MESVIGFVLIHRRVIAATLAALAVWSGITAVTHSPDTRTVLVAARDLDGGRIVSRADLQVRRLPHAAVPTGTVGSQDVTGAHGA